MAENRRRTFFDLANSQMQSPTILATNEPRVGTNPPNDRNPTLELGRIRTRPSQTRFPSRPSNPPAGSQLPERPPMTDREAEIEFGNRQFLQAVALALMPQDAAETLMKSIFGSVDKGMQTIRTGRSTERDMQRHRILAAQGENVLEVLKAREQVQAERQARPGRTQTILTRRD